MQLVLAMGDTFVALWPPLAERVKLRQAKELVIRPKSRLPITPAILNQLKQFWEKDRHNGYHIML